MVLALVAAVLWVALVRARRRAAAAEQRVAGLARLRHDLRTPLNAILGNVQALRRDGGERPELAEIETAGHELLRRIDEATAGARGERPAAARPAPHDAPDLAAHLGAYSPEQRRRLLDELLVGDLEAALAVADECGAPAARAAVRGLIERFEVEPLITALEGEG